MQILLTSVWDDVDLDLVQGVGHVSSKGQAAPARGQTVCSNRAFIPVLGQGDGLDEP